MIITDSLHFIIFDYVSIWTDLENHSDTAMLALQKKKNTTAIAPALGPGACLSRRNNVAEAIGTAIQPWPLVQFVECCPIH